ncbi:hypothetical protein PGABG02_0001900 [Plasmodium sp. DRC-Itaito]|nr:hypothetical protein PGABG02_0001900 [Plasmodium sp. DRC-Itaito]
MKNDFKKKESNAKINAIKIFNEIGKQMEETFLELEEDIQSNAIPTCTYQKSLADTMEKNLYKMWKKIRGSSRVGNIRVISKFDLRIICWCSIGKYY